MINSKPDKCPFADPEFTMHVAAPCPVCGATGFIGDWIEAEDKCIEPSTPKPIRKEYNQLPL